MWVHFEMVLIVIFKYVTLKFARVVGVEKGLNFGCGKIYNTFQFNTTPVLICNFLSLPPHFTAYSLILSKQKQGITNKYDIFE